jgi:diguanylate cyclase (GGDEF)-like protein
MKRVFHHDRRGITIHFFVAWLFFYIALHLAYLAFETYRQDQRQQVALDSALQRIDFYDTVLTQAAKSGIHDRSTDWERQYEAGLQQLERTLEVIINELPVTNAEIIALQQSNTELIAIERMAFSMSKQNRPRAATALLDSVSYTTAKQRFAAASAGLDAALTQQHGYSRERMRLKFWSFGGGILLMLALMWWMLGRAYKQLDRKLMQEQTKQQLAERLLAPESAPLDEDIAWTLQLLAENTGADMAMLIRWRPDGDPHRWAWHTADLPQITHCIQVFGDLLESQPPPPDAVLDAEQLRRHFTPLQAPCNILENAPGILCITSPVVSGRHSALVFVRMRNRRHWSEDQITGIKSFAETLSRSIDKRDQEARMYQLATTDSLTGLANHRHFIEQLNLEMKRTRRSGASCALLMMDIDHFKAVNDTYGHEAGDAVLVQLTNSMRSALRDIDTFGRLGGEEFAAVLPGAGVATAMQVAERLRSCVEGSRVATRAGTIGVTISIGITSASGADDDVDAALRRADNAMYQAKNEGRNCVRMVLP